MARIGLLLLSLIQWSNVYAWSCSFSQTSDGWYQDGSMVCDGIGVQDALENHYCEWFRPDDPYCSQYQVPVCIDAIEYRTMACEPTHQGGIQQSRQYLCNQASWTDWTTTSNNCTPIYVCSETSDSRTLQCPQGFDGTIVQTRLGQCPQPYAEPVFTEWSETENSCVQSQTDPTSPIAVTNPLNPVTSTAVESVTVPQIDVQQTTNEPTIESVVKEELSNSSDDVKNKTDNKANSTKEVKQDKQDGDKEKSKDDVDEVVEDSKEIVHGFGLVLSLEILNKPMEFYQPPLTDMFSIAQEFPIHADTREFQLDLLKRNDIEDYYNTVSDSAWQRIRWGDLFQ